MWGYSDTTFAHDPSPPPETSPSNRSTTVVAVPVSISSPWARNSASQADTDDWRGVDRDLFERLRKWRRQIAEARGKPAWTILDDKALRAIAREKPDSPAALLRCKGIGEKRLADFGSEILDLVGGGSAG